MLLGCAAQGLSYIYYSFFSCVLLGAAGLLGWLRTRRLATLRLAAAGVALIVLGTAVGLAPSLLYWHEHGRNPDLQYKLVLEADLFALKIRHLLVPIPDHPFAPFRALAAAAAAGFLGDNENAMGRLGTVGSLGFLGLLGHAVGSAAGLVRGERRRLAAAAALTLVCLLLAQVGGFGSLFSLLVSPDIRAYNRIVVFIAFFSLLAAGLAFEHLERATIDRVRVRPALVRGGDPPPPPRRLRPGQHHGAAARPRRETPGSSTCTASSSAAWSLAFRRGPWSSSSPTRACP